MKRPLIWTIPPDGVNPGFVAALSAQYICFDQSLEPGRYRFLSKYLPQTPRPEIVFRTRTPPQVSPYPSRQTTPPRRKKAPGTVIFIDSISQIAFLNGAIGIEHRAVTGSHCCDSFACNDHKILKQIFEQLRRQMGPDVETAVDPGVARSLFGAESLMTVIRTTEAAIPPHSRRRRGPPPTEKEIFQHLSKLSDSPADDKREHDAPFPHAEPIEESAAELLERARKTSARRTSWWRFW